MKAQAVYDFIRDFKLAYDGVGPTFREIMDGTGIMSTSNVKGYLLKLEEAGLIRLMRENQTETLTPRGIRLTHGAYIVRPDAYDVDVEEMVK